MNTGFFEESPGNFSMTRLLVFILIVYAVAMSGAIGLVGLYKFATFVPLLGVSPPTLMDIVLAMGSLLSSVTAFAAGWKLLQKPMEKSSDSLPSENNKETA